MNKKSRTATIENGNPAIFDRIAGRLRYLKDPWFSVPISQLVWLFHIYGIILRNRYMSIGFG